MSKKWFHPTNIGNMKRQYMAEQKSADEKRRQQELREQYEREQEIFSNKQLMGDEKARLVFHLCTIHQLEWLNKKNHNTRTRT